MLTTKIKAGHYYFVGPSPNPLLVVKIIDLHPGEWNKTVTFIKALVQDETGEAWEWTFMESDFREFETK